MKTRIIIFGATGDLMQRKLAQALNLLNSEYPNNVYEVYGFGRRDLDDNTFRSFLKENTGNHLDNDFLEKIHYFKGEFHSLEDFKKFKDTIICDDFENIYYLAIPQELYSCVLNNLHNSSLITDRDKLLLEKPIGLDYKSALEVEDIIDNHFSLDQLYRIDHYLAKSQLNSILYLRKNNFIIENIFSNKFIKKIEVVLNEDIDVDNRGSFYDKVGTLIDMGLNHGLSIFAYLLMDISDQLTQNNIVNSRINALNDLEILDKEFIKSNSFIAQYKGYTDINGVDKSSLTETYFRLRLKSNNSNWRDVDLILESGKALKDRENKVVIYLKDNTRIELDMSQTSNILLNLNYISKKNLDFEIENLCLKGCIDHTVDKRYSQEYAKIFLEAINSNKSYFLSREEVLRSWKIIEPIKECWKNREVNLNIYDKFSNNIVNQSRLVIN